MCGRRKRTSVAQPGNRRWAFPSAAKDISAPAEMPSGRPRISGNGTRGLIHGRKKQTSRDPQDMAPPAFQSALKDISAQGSSVIAAGGRMIYGNGTRRLMRGPLRLVPAQRRGTFLWDFPLAA